MCILIGASWKCGHIFKTWKPCESAGKNRTEPGPECAETFHAHRIWKAPNLEQVGAEEFSRRFYNRSNWAFVRTSCCSPHCCIADLAEYAKRVDYHKNLGQDLWSTKRSYATRVHHHMNNCMPLFAKGLWRTNSVILRMDEAPEKDVISILDFDYIPEPMHPQFFDGNQPSYLEYKNRISQGLGLQANAGELHWRTLLDQFMVYAEAIKAKETPLQATKAAVGSVQASAGSPVPPGSVAPSSLVTRGRQLILTSPSPRQASRQNSSSASPKQSSSKAPERARTDPVSQLPAPFADELPMESLRGIGDSPPPSMSSKPGSPVIRAQGDRPRQPSPLRQSVPVPSSGGSGHLAIPLRFSPSPDSELKWIEVCNRKDEDRKLFKTLLPATRQSWDPFNEGVDEFQQGISIYVHALKESRAIEDFSMRQRKQLCVTDVARFRWLVKNFVQIQDSIRGLNLAPRFEEPMIKQMRNLHDMLKGLEVIHTQWMQALSVAEQQELKEQISAA